MKNKSFYYYIYNIIEFNIKKKISNKKIFINKIFFLIKI